MPVSATPGYAGRLFVKTGSRLEESMNYARAIRDGDWVYVSNTSGFHYDENRLDSDVVSQAKQMIENVTDALAAAGATRQDIVRAVIFCPDKSDFPAVMPILKEFFDGVWPALTAICSPLGDESLKIEMEVTAKVGATA